MGAGRNLNDEERENRGRISFRSIKRKVFLGLIVVKNS